MPDQHEEAQTIRPTAGRFLGSFVAVTAAVVAVVAIRESEASWAAGAVLVGVLAWAAMLRPTLTVTADELVMRNMVDTIRIPLAAIEQLAVTQVLAVRAGKRYVSPVVGKSWGKDVVAERRGWTRSEEVRVAGVDYADFVVEDLHRRMERARTAAGVTLLSDEQAELARGVRRQVAWLPTGLLLASAVALVAALLL